VPGERWGGERAASANSTVVNRLLTAIETWLMGKPITVRRAGIAIATVTIVVTVASGLLISVLDQRDFPTVGAGLWWAAQTVTTVGYGDVVPGNSGAKFLAVLVMISGIAFVTVVTAAITAAFVESARGRLAGQRDAGIEAKLDEISRRLAVLESRD
jgi:voltage-gated potassium channel